MIKVFKLVNNEWQEIENILQGLTFTEVLDDSLDTGLIQYDSLSDELMPVFTPIKVEHYHKPNDSKKVANNNLTIIIQSNGFYKCSGGDYYSLFGDVIVGDIIYLNNQTNKITKGIYKVVSTSGFDIYLENLDEFFLSAEERVTPFTKANPITYRHQLIIVEPTKYLEKIMVNNLCLTNKNDTLKQQLDKALINCMLLEASESPIFSVSSELSAFLGQTPGEDFFFDKANLREILDGILATVNARVYIEQITDFDNILISYVDMNEVKETIEFEKMVSMERTNNAETYHGQIVASGSNAKINTPISHGWVSFKTTEATLTTTNATIFTDFQIETITYFKVLCEATVKTGPTYDEITQIIDEVVITNYVFDEEAYKTLLPSNGNYNQQNSIYYTRASKRIDAQASTKLLFFQLSNIKNAIISELKKQFGVDARITFVNRDLLDFLILMVYYPYIEAYGTITKPYNNDERLSRLTLLDNQTEKIIDMDRYGLNLLGKTTRLGNDDYCVDDLVNSVDELKKIGQKTSENFIIYKKEISYFNEYAKVRYTLSKNYNNLNEKISLNREKRIYNISLNAYEKEILIKEYILISNLPLEDNPDLSPNKTGNITDIGIKLLVGATSYIGENNYLLFETNTSEGKKGEFELNVASYVLGNAMHFVARNFDNYSVGVSVGGNAIGGSKTIYNPYVDTNGEFLTIKPKLVRGKNASDNANINKAKLLPKTNYTYYGHELIAPVSYNYKKDSFQQININYQIELRPTNDLEKAIIIGRKLLYSNGFFDIGTATFSGGVKIYASTEKYTIFDNLKAKGTVQTGMGINIVANKVKITGTLTLQNAKSLAIADNSGNLFLATNLVQQTFRTFYFISSKTIQ